MRLFIYTPNIPFPLHSGGNISQFTILKALEKLLDITVCVPLLSNEDADRVKNLQTKLPHVRFLPLEHRRKRVKANWKTKVRNLIGATVSGGKGSNDEFDDSHRINPVILKSEKLINGLSAIVSSEEFDLYQFEFYEAIDLVHLVPQGKPKIFVHHEIKFQRLSRVAEVSGKSLSFKQYIIQSVKVTELAALKLYDAVITFSEVDNSILQREALLQTVSIPFPVLEDTILDEVSFAGVDKLIFLGPEEHYPNYEGIDWFIRTCFPDIYQQVGLPLMVLGNWSEATIEKYAHIKGLTFVGYVHDLTPYFASGISISPIRIGSGIRTKILYAMAAGSPVVSTHVGIEGIDVEHNKHFLRANSAEDFLEAVRRIKGDTDFAKALTENALSFVKLHYHPDQIAQRRLALYKKLMN